MQVIEQKESRVDKHMLLVLDYFYTQNKMSPEFETRHLWTLTIILGFSRYVY